MNVSANEEQLEQRLDVADAFLAERMVTIQIAGYKPITDISADRVHQTLVELEPAPDLKAAPLEVGQPPAGQRLSIICELSVINGAKVLHIHSMYCIHNQTAYALEMFGRRVERGQMFWVPLNASSNYSFTFRPISHPNVGDAYEESQPIPLQFNEPTDTFAACLARSPQADGQAHPEAPINYYVNVESRMVKITLGFE